MPTFKIAVPVDDGDPERTDARRKRLPEFVDPIRDASWDVYLDELEVDAPSMADAMRRAREIVRGAFDGTALYVNPQPIGEWPG
ncbi:hypothetical protein [Baekduia sp. Peel2402]|uniref:hypothetical protein n=1 Tax=Baekduia sp. Peel2402 TaxID=3458296 RepID=UPI00403ED65D